MKQFALLTFTCYLFACRPQEDKNNFATLIKGDWVGQQQSKEYPNDSYAVFACFEDSTCLKSLMQDGTHAA